MINLTIFSLTLSSIYSPSPLLTDNRNIIQNSNFQYFFPTLFFNLKELLLEDSVFSKGMGSVLYSDFRNHMHVKDEDMHDEKHDSYKIVSMKGYGELYKIRNCTFKNFEIWKQRLILIEGHPTFYMTNCLFHSILTESGLLRIDAKACMISHICCSDIQSKDGNSANALLLETNGQSGSFFKFIFSTFHGNEFDHNYLHLFKLNGEVALRHQCVNISTYKLKDSLDNSAFRLFTPACLKMMMSTFEKVTAKRIFHYNLQSKNKSYSHYISMCNFVENTFSDSCIYADSNQNEQMTIELTVFSCTSSSSNDNSKYKYIVKASESGNFTISNCVFNYDYWTTDSPENNGYHYIGSSKDANKVNDLPYYVLPEYCEGVVKDNAYGCNNDTCPDLTGCPPEAFEFIKGDKSYTEEHDPYIHTPTPSPSIVFSESIPFSYSAQFSLSNFSLNQQPLAIPECLQVLQNSVLQAISHIHLILQRQLTSHHHFIFPIPNNLVHLLILQIRRSSLHLFIFPIPSNLVHLLILQIRKSSLHLFIFPIPSNLVHLFILQIRKSSLHLFIFPIPSNLVHLFILQIRKSSLHLFIFPIPNNLVHLLILQIRKSSLHLCIFQKQMIFLKHKNLQNLIYLQDQKILPIHFCFRVQVGFQKQVILQRPVDSLKPVTSLKLLDSPKQVAFQNQKISRYHLHLRQQKILIIRIRFHLQKGSLIQTLFQTQFHLQILLNFQDRLTLQKLENFPKQDTFQRRQILPSQLTFRNQPILRAQALLLKQQVSPKRRISQKLVISLKPLISQNRLISLNHTVLSQLTICTIRIHFRLLALSLHLASFLLRFTLQIQNTFQGLAGSQKLELFLRQVNSQKVTNFLSQVNFHRQIIFLHRKHTFKEPALSSISRLTTATR
ncbi:hypothetical protein M9Y10_013380 [Tritrichomonas musculus]|uniref:Uncharacterized protein n=1 Tax=Tritrichomonas musculus TaxID=1915356 RepID=A0ABR2I6V1_9EUKA